MEAMVLTNPFLPSTHGRMLMFWNITPCFVWFPLHAFNSQLPQAKENGNKKKKKALASLSILNSLYHKNLLT
jgi:hypothetical protein